MNKETLVKIFSKIPTIETERLILRAMSTRDSADMFDYSSRGELTKYLLWSPHNTVNYTREYLSYIESLAAFADKASENGVLTVLRLRNKGHDGGLNDRTLEIFKQKLDGEWKWGIRGARIRHKLHLEYGDRFDWPDMEAENMGNCLFCYGLRDHFGILCDGSVIPCCLDHEGDITLGNAFETPIKDILSSERAVNILSGFDNRIAVEELCQKCGYARRFG